MAIVSSTKRLPRALERLRALFNHPLLAVLERVESLAKWTVAVALLAAGVAVAAFEVVTHAGVIADVFLGLGVFVLGLWAVGKLRHGLTRGEREGAAIAEMAARLASPEMASAHASMAETLERLQPVEHESNVAREPVSPEHRAALQGVASTLLSYVRVSQHAFYGDKGDERRARAFAEHFPDEAQLVTGWNGRVARLEADRRELRAWLEARLRMLAYDKPPYAGGWERMIAAVAEQDPPNLVFSVPPIEPLCLHLGPYVVVQLPPANGRTREEIEAELQGVLAEAVAQPQRQCVRDALVAVFEAREPLIDELELIRDKDVINGLGGCLLCR